MADLGDVAAVRMRQGYRSALQEHLDRPGEETLRLAYELGRDAVVLEVSVLELAGAHHDVLTAALRGAEGPQAEELTAAAGAFLMESLSTYEMVRRGYQEAAWAAALERRHAQAIRRLSSFLADASLASAASDAREEVLQLLAETAAELAGADACVVTIRQKAGSLYAAVSSPPQVLEALGDRRDGQFLAVQALLAADDPIRLTRESLEARPRISAVAGDHVPAGWLAATLAALDGRPLGFIQVYDWPEGRPTEVQEALVVHLAQMAAAALERTALYLA